MEIFLIIWAIWVLFMFKNYNTSRNHDLIIRAIHIYNMHKIHNFEFNSLIDYECMEEYGKTFWRLWDWSCKYIVPPEIYAELYPYIYENN